MLLGDQTFQTVSQRLLAAVAPGQKSYSNYTLTRVRMQFVKVCLCVLPLSPALKGL